MTFSLFFKVSNIVVEGNAVCTAQDIISASTIEDGDFLLLINRVTAIRNIKLKQPYIDEVVIKQRLPDTVLIQVTETKPLVCFLHHENYWLADRNGKLLEHRREAPGLPLVTGVPLLTPIEGTDIAFPSEQESKSGALLDILEVLSGLDMMGDVQSFDLTDIAGLKFRYMDRFTVNLGVANDLQRKLEFLPEAIQQIEHNAQGTIDLSGVPEYKTARFIPN